MRYHASKTRNAILFLCAFDPPCKFNMRVGRDLGDLGRANVGCAHDER